MRRPKTIAGLRDIEWEGLAGDFDAELRAAGVLRADDFQIIHSPARGFVVPRDGVLRIGPGFDGIVFGVQFRGGAVDLRFLGGEVDFAVGQLRGGPKLRVEKAGREKQTQDRGSNRIPIHGVRVLSRASREKLRCSVIVTDEKIDFSHETTQQIGVEAIGADFRKKIIVIIVYDCVTGGARHERSLYRRERSECYIR